MTVRMGRVELPDHRLSTGEVCQFPSHPLAAPGGGPARERCPRRESNAHYRRSGCRSSTSWDTRAMWTDTLPSGGRGDGGRSRTCTAEAGALPALGLATCPGTAAATAPDSRGICSSTVELPRLRFRTRKGGRGLSRFLSQGGKQKPPCAACLLPGGPRYDPESLPVTHARQEKQSPAVSIRPEMDGVAHLDRVRGVAGCAPGHPGRDRVPRHHATHSWIRVSD